MNPILLGILFEINKTNLEIPGKTNVGSVSKAKELECIFT